MQAFDYLAPRSHEEAYGHLGNGKSTLFLAGGTDVIVQLREGRKRCDQLIDLKHIPELVAHGFAADGTLEIGAAAPLAEIYEDPEVASRLPGLIDAASLIGGIQIQSRASLGGNLCNASPAADSTPALMALGATLRIGSKSGTRDIPVEEFFAGPGRNTLAPDEILLQVRIPAQPPRSGAFYLRFIPRNEMDIAVASAGARVVLSSGGDTFESARIALGAVGPTVISATAAADSLAGKPANDASIQAAGDLASEVATPITDMRGSVAQRRKLASVLTVRALQGALARARENR
jgi:CO/xanthine dehydrogenase FAD-binding subunit